jgi:hypothetical protein
MSGAVNQAPLAVTIVTHRPGCVEMPWIRFLLGDWAGEVVDDPDRRLVLPNSLLVSDRPGGLRSRVKAEIRRHGTVGLVHVGDKRYRSGLDAYGSFGFVWRTYYHSGLTDLEVRQLPLGPAAVPMVTAQPSSVALRRPVERLYTWCLVDRAQPTHGPVLEAFRQIEGGLEQLDDGGGGGRGRRGESRDLAERDPVAYMELLGDSVFVACPMSDQHIETTRVYDALEVGAIPIVERRRRLDYFGALLGNHPLPTVRSWSDATGLVQGLLADHGALTQLHDRVVSWWTSTKRSLAETAQRDVASCLSGVRVGSPLAGGPLDTPAPRWRGQVELLRHNGPLIRRRG